MHFIHTADWHLGNQMHDIDRHDEAQFFLRWLKKQIVEKNADTLIIAGDIFDTANPSVEARRLYYTFLASLHDTNCKNVIIIGGNHDSAMLLDAPKDLFEVQNIHVVGSITNLSPCDMCFELRDTHNDVCGICMAIPYVREIELRKLIADTLADSDVYAVAYKTLYQQVYEEAERLRAGRNIPIIATGHLYAADLEGRLASVASNIKTDDGVKVLDVLGNLGNVPPSVFPPTDYVALGHIHYTTTVAGNTAVRYSGSPFVMGFDEADMPHYVLNVSITPGNTPQIEKIETPRTVIYKRISGTLAHIKATLHTLQSTKPVYLELCYKKEVGVNAQDFLDDAVHALPELVSVVSWKVLEQNSMFAGNSFTSFDAPELKNLDDTEIFTQLILSKEKLDPDSDEAKNMLDTFLPLFLQIAAEVE